MLWTLIWTFTLYSIALIPTMMYFMEGGAYSAVPAAIKSNYLDTYLGNMGYSSVQCTSVPLSLEKISLSCPYGAIGTFLDFGVNTSLEDKKVCQTTAINAPCKPDNQALAE